MLYSTTNGRHAIGEGRGCEALANPSLVRVTTPEPLRLQINGTRVWNEIIETASLGGIPNTTGMNRLALSESDREIRDVFVERARSMGCRIVVDEMGNIFAILAGLDDTLPPIGIGSHLDTQPSGGRFDGILGVLGALEVLQCFKENKIIPHRPIAAINWTNEEGARFESGCTGSAVWAGYMSLEQGYNLKTMHESSTLHDELCAIGYKGSTPADFRSNPLSAHFELHIEQGPRLERAERKIGIVKGIQGNRRMQVNVQGQKAHSGTTPMQARSDALVAASNIVIAVNAVGFKYGGFATVGIMNCEDSSINCVPGKAFFTIDLRHPSGESLDAMEQTIRTEMKKLERTKANLHFEIEKIWESPAARFDEAMVDCVKSSALERFGSLALAELNSFAGHDSAMTHLCVPTAMIFVPSRDGISHSPNEFTSQEQCADGVQVLADAVLSYDQMLARKSEHKDSAIVVIEKGMI